MAKCRIFDTTSFLFADEREENSNKGIFNCAGASVVLDETDSEDALALGEDLLTLDELRDQEDSEDNSDEEDTYPLSDDMEYEGDGGDASPSEESDWE
jgi:hypothetical protein